VRVYDLYMRFDLGAQLLEMLDDGTVDGAPKVGVLVSYDTSLVTDAVVDILSFF